MGHRSEIREARIGPTPTGKLLLLRIRVVAEALAPACNYCRAMRAIVAIDMPHPEIVRDRAKAEPEREQQREHTQNARHPRNAAVAA
jgi:hypothetical protein